MKISAIQIFSGWSFSSNLFLLLCILAFAAAAIFFAAFCIARKIDRWRIQSQKHPASDIAAEHYDVASIVKSIQNLSGRQQTLLLAADTITDLPVTVPVNLAIQLARKAKCLLIDLDLNRDSIAKVFELEPRTPDTGLHTSSLQTAINNLFVWPARHFKAQMNLCHIVKEAQKKYDYILLYAPYLTTLADRKQIASCVKHAFVFGKHREQGDRLLTLLDLYNCKILEK